MKLPWSKGEYQKLDPHDFLPTPAPTAEQRLRVAAALATYARDGQLTGAHPLPNMETIRAILVMDAEAWARDIGELRQILSVYDAEDPKKRFDQMVRASTRGLSS